MDQCLFYNNNCFSCQQQNKYLKDIWKQQIRPFYYEFIEVPFSHLYTQFAQSLNKNDFEIICLNCNDKLQEQECKKIKGCKHCKKDNNTINICVDCQNDEKNTFTLQNNQCNLCLPQCNVCRKRSHKEIQKLNPYFKSNYDNFECLQLKDSDSYYDKDINQFVQCKKFSQGCQKVMIYSKALSCQFYDYRDEYESSKVHILLPSYAKDPELKFPDILNLAKEQKIKKIILRLISKEPSNCRLQDIIMNQGYSESIFNLFEVELEIICLHETIWNVEGNVIFENFTKITINGLVVKIQQTWRSKYLEFQGSANLKVIFNNVTFQHQTARKDHFQLRFSNTTIINFINSTFSNFYLVQNTSLIYLYYSNQNKTISFFQSKFQNLTFIDSQILHVETEKNNQFNIDKFVFNSININGYFFNSSLILTEYSNVFGQIEIYNITIQDSVIQNCESFIPLFTFQDIYIDYFVMFRVNFTNSVFIELSQKNQIYNLNITQCSLVSKVHLIKNRAQNFIQNLFVNISITENVYSRFSKFLLIKKFSLLNSEFFLNNITLKSNTIDELNFDINFMDPAFSLIFIEQNTIKCIKIHIEKSFGLSEFTFEKSQSLILQEIYVTQGNLFRQKGINYQFEGFSQFNQIKQNGIAFYFFSVKYVFIHKLFVQQAQSLDYPIIYYLSQSKATQIQKETLILSSINFQDNILIQTRLEIQAALILIESGQELEIFVNESSFNRNILQSYSQLYFGNQALIFNINAQQCNLQFSNNLFEKNIIINSKASIFYILSTNTYILNCSFFQSNKFLYEVLQPNLYWPFDLSYKIYIENLQEKLTIQSLSGNGYLKTQNLNVNNSQFFDCQGVKATSLYLQIINKANIMIENSIFKVNQINIYDYTQKGCVIYVDSSASQNVFIKIKNVTVDTIYSTEKGGFLSVIQGSGQFSLTLDNIQLVDVFSTSGSIIYFSGLDAKKKQINLNLKNLYYLSSKKVYSNFIIWYNYQIQRQKNILKQTIFLNEILNNQSLIYIYKVSTLKIENLQIQNLFFKKVLNIQMVNIIQLSEILIQNSFLKDGIILVKPDKTIEAQILFEKVKISYLQSGCLIFEHQKLEVVYPEATYQNCEKNNNQQAPIFLQSFITSGNNFFEKINSTISEDCQFSDQTYGMIHFESLNQLHQLKLNQFHITNVNFSNCQNGLISINFQKQLSMLKQQEINNFIISNSICGLKGCLKISVLPQGELFNDTNDSYTFENIEFFIFDYLCQYNQAQNGTCLYLEEAKIIISSCDFRYNNASGAGGTIYSKKSAITNQLILKETLITDNIAFIGGGIYMEDQQEINFQKLDSIVSGNKGQFYANDISAIPSQLKIQINGISDELFQVQAIIENDTFSLFAQKLKNQTQLYGILTNYTMLPNGMQIAQYQYFDWKNRIYIPLNFTFRILPLTGMGVQIKNLKNSFCSIKSTSIILLFKINLIIVKASSQLQSYKFKYTFFLAALIENLVTKFSNQFCQLNFTLLLEHNIIIKLYFQSTDSQYANICLISQCRLQILFIQ